MLKKISYVLLMFIGIFYLYYCRSCLVALKNISVVNVVIITTLSFGTFFFLAVQFKSLVEIFHLDLDFNEWFGLTVINTMVSYYTPARGGLIARGYYLNCKYNLSYSNYVSLLVGSYLINFFVASVGTIFFSFFAGLSSGYLNYNILWVGVGLLVGSIAISLLVFRLCSLDFDLGKFGKFLRNVVDGMNLFRNHPRLVIKIAIVQLCVLVMMAIKLFWSFKAVGKPVALQDVLIVQSLVTFSMVISITPGNLGIKEGIIGLLASQFGVSFSDAVLAASVDRGISLLMTFMLGLSYSKILFYGDPAVKSSCK